MLLQLSINLALCKVDGKRKITFHICRSIRMIQNIYRPILTINALSFKKPLISQVYFYGCKIIKKLMSLYTKYNFICIASVNKVDILLIINDLAKSRLVI